MARTSLSEKYEKSKLQQRPQWTDKQSRSPLYRDNGESNFLPRSKIAGPSDLEESVRPYLSIQRPILPPGLSNNAVEPRTYEYNHRNNIERNLTSFETHKEHHSGKRPRIYDYNYKDREERPNSNFLQTQNSKSGELPRTYDYNYNDREERPNLNSFATHNSQQPVKPSLNDVNSTITRVYESPIKSIRFTPSKLRPAKIYKVLNHPTPRGGTPRVTPLRSRTGGILLNKDKVSKYSPRTSTKVRSDTRLKQTQKGGMFHKLRSFLSSLTNSEEDSDFDRLSKSAKDLLNFKSDPLPMRKQPATTQDHHNNNARMSRKRVNFGESLQTPVKSQPPFMVSTPIETAEKQNHDDDTLEDIVPIMDEPPHRSSNGTPATSPNQVKYDSAEDNDIVDHTLRINSELRKKQELTDRIQSLMRALGEEKDRNRSMEREFEIELSNIKRQHTLRIQQLEDKIRSLEATAANKRYEFEATRIEEIRSAVWKEHESFLIKQKKQEQRLDQLSKSLEDQKRSLDDEWNRLANAQSNRATDQEIGPVRFDILDDDSEQSFALIEEDFPKEHKDPKKVFEEAMSEYRSEQADLSIQKTAISSSLKSFEDKLIKLTERVERQSRNIFDKRSGVNSGEYELVEGAELLLDLMKRLEQRQDNDLLQRDHKYSSIDRNIMNYFEKLQTTINALESNTPDYDMIFESFDLPGVEHSFHDLKKNLEKKFVKRQNKLAHLDDEISRGLAKLRQDSFYSQRSLARGTNKSILKSVINAFDTIFTLLGELKCLNSLLLKLSVLTQDLTEVKLRLEYGVGFENSIQDDGF